MGITGCFEFSRPATARGMREESDYWDPQAQVQDIDNQIDSPSQLAKQMTANSCSQTAMQVTNQALGLNKSSSTVEGGSGNSSSVGHQHQTSSATTPSSLSSISPSLSHQQLSHVPHNRSHTPQPQQQVSLVAHASQQTQQQMSHYQTISQTQTPIHTPHPPSTPVPGQPQQTLSVVGDFLDEDGNPCSNV